MPSDICIIFYSVSQYRTGKGLSSLAWQDFWHSQPAAPHRPNPCCCSFLLLRGSQAACLPLTVGQAARGGGGCGEAPGTEDPHERRAEAGMGGVYWELHRLRGKEKQKMWMGKRITGKQNKMMVWHEILIMTSLLSYCPQALTTTPKLQAKPTDQGDNGRLLWVRLGEKRGGDEKGEKCP